MVLSLESEIMAEIGLGQHYSWYNGSGCADVRRRAITRLPEAIQAHHDAGERISAPIGVLIALVREAAEYLDRSAYSLTNTWQCASSVIQTHEHVAINAGRDTEMSMADACAEFWTPKIRAAAERIDMMGFYAEDWLHGSERPSTTGRKFKL